MSKSSTATAPKRSAWSKGTPQTPSAPTVRSSAPAQTRSRRSSAFGQGVPIKDGVGIPRTPSAYSPAPPPPPHSRHPSALGQGVPNKDGVSIPRTPRSYSPAPSPPPQSHSRRPIPKKSAWSKGPPQTPSPPTLRSSPPAQSRSRRPSALGQGVPIKDGVSIPRSKVRAAARKQGSVITFGSIDDPSAPISSSPAAAPPIKSEGVKLSHRVPYTPPQPSMSSVSSPPPTPSTASLPTTRLNINSNAFVPTGRAKITLKSADGQQVKLEKLTKTNPSSATTPLPVFRPGTPTRRRTRIRLETEDQRRKRLAEEEEKEQEKIRAKAQADEKVKPEKTPSSATTALPPQGSVYRQGSPGTPTRRPTSIRMETEDQRRKRLAEEEKKEQEKTRAKAEADEKVKLEKIPSSATTALPPQGSAYRQGSLGTPTRRPTSIRMETEDQRRKRLAEEEMKEQEKTRAKLEADEKVKLEKTHSLATTALPPQDSVYRQGSVWTPTWRPTSIRMETEDQRRKRLAEEDEK